MLKSLNRVVAAFFVLALLIPLGSCSTDTEPKSCEDELDQSQACIEIRANNGNVKAQYSMAERYLQQNATKVGPDEFKAVSWLMKAAEGGHLEAQYRLGNAYSIGAGGLPKDMNKAEYWWVKSATGGNLKAQIKLGEEYYDGGLFNLLKFAGLKKNGKDSFKWFLKASSSGNSYAQARLAKEYARGTFVDQDFVLACAWLILAANGDPEKNMEERDEIASGLSAAERQEAERLAANWRAGQTITR